MMQQTSIDAYREIKTKLGPRQQIIYDQMQVSGPCTNQKMADLLGWQINLVTPRMNELVKLGYIKKMYEEPGKYGKMAIVWGVILG